MENQSSNLPTNKILWSLKDLIFFLSLTINKENLQELYNHKSTYLQRKEKTNFLSQI